MIAKLFLIAILLLPIVWIVVHYTRLYRRTMEEGRVVEFQLEDL